MMRVWTKTSPSGMKLRWLLATLERLDFRQRGGQQAAFIEQIEAADPPGREKDLHQFLANPLGTDLVDMLRIFADGPPCGAIEIEAQRGAEAHGAQQAQPVLAKTVVGIADGAQHLPGEIPPGRRHSR